MAGFYYVTYKYVLLKDSRLGVLYYLVAMLILVYSVVEIFIRKGYLQFDTNPQGTIKVMLSDDFADVSFDITKQSYCRSNYSCLYLDPWDLNWPIESRAVTITTFAKDRLQVLVANSNSPLDKYRTIEEKPYFTQAPENVVLKVDHAVVAGLFTDSKGKEKLAVSHRQITGYLADSDGNIVRRVSKQGKPDKLTVQELLSMSGVQDLDQESDSVGSRGRSFRERGCILRVSIFYHNWLHTWLGTSDVEYIYRVKRVPFIDYSVKQIQHISDKKQGKSSRMMRKIHAVRVEFYQEGSLGVFCMSTLLLQLVSGMGLLTITATIIDSLALYILPDRGQYRKSVYEESPEITPRKKL